MNGRTDERNNGTAGKHRPMAFADTVGWRIHKDGVRFFAPPCMYSG